VQRGLDRLAVKRGLELEEIVRWTHGEGHGRPVIGHDIGHGEGHEQIVVDVAIIAEGIDDADLVLRNEELLALHGDLAMEHEFQPARGQHGGRVIGQSGCGENRQNKRTHRTHQAPPRCQSSPEVLA
jgi:hypothetical protein